jgi:hypothetical protein
MGYAFAMGPCLLCRRPFTFNPLTVPSFRVNGDREPICQSCIEAVNRKRVEAGVEPFTIAPDAYEPCDEGELDV